MLPPLIMDCVLYNVWTILTKGYALKINGPLFLHMEPTLRTFLFFPLSPAAANLRPGAEQKVVFITARVHPGETPSSFVCQGECLHEDSGSGKYWFPIDAHTGCAQL